jgi:predicted nucleic acid-binding Zn ribbon protein
MEDKKFCINCGEEIPKESIFCSKCGASIKASGIDLKNKPVSKNKALLPIALILIIVVVGVYALLPKYEIDEYNELIDKINIEIELGNAAIEKYDREIESSTEIWEGISWSTENTYILQTNLNVMKNVDKNLNNNTESLNAANQHFSKAISYYKEIKDLYLPDWYYQYTDLKIKSLEKMQEALATRISTDNKRKDMRKTAIGVIDGAIELIKGSEELIKLDQYIYSNNYVAAEQSLTKSTQYLGASINKWNESYKTVPLISLRSAINAVECIQSSVDYLIDAIYYEKRGNYYKSEELAELAFNNLEKCVQIRSYENMGLELDLWVTKNIDPLVREEERLFSEADSFDKEAQDLWDKNNK